jgi:DNA polymerase
MLPIFQPYERPDARAPDELRPRTLLEAAIRQCQRCPLGDDRTNAVLDSGSANARILLLGGAPGRSEDLTGQPFSGASGNVVTRALAAVGLDRDDVLLSNVVRCRPPDDRAPVGLELETCHPWLLEEVALHRPEVVLTLGALPAATLLRRRVPVERIAGHRLRLWDGTWLVPTHDPMDAVRGNAKVAAALRRDLRTALRLLDAADEQPA